MKKTAFTVTLLLLLLSLVHVYACAASAGLSGPGAVRAGDTIKLNLYIDGTNLQAVRGVLTYDANLLEYKGSGETLSGWAVDVNQSAGRITVLGIDDKLEAPINGSKKLLSVTFTVNQNAASGTAVTVTASELSGSDGTQDIGISGSSYSVSLSAPLSSNNQLKSLSVSGVNITPTFSPNTTAYSANVAYSVSKVSVSAAAEDPDATVAIAGTALKVGKNNVTVTVTAPNGAAKTYTIQVTRAQDPNYKASSNANLKSITVDNGILSPAFDAQRTEYVLYLPYEIETFSAAGEAEDPKAQGVSSEEIDLEPGENPYEILCTAEDGTEKAYTITVHRMPEIGTTVTPSPTVTIDENQPPKAEAATPTPAPTPSPTPAPAATPEEADDPAYIEEVVPGGGISVTVLILACIGSCAVGAAAAYLFLRKSITGRANS